MALVVVAMVGLLAVLVTGSLEDSGAWQALLEDGDYLGRLAFSLAQAAAATAVGLAIGLPASWFLSRGGVPARGLLALLVATPIAIPGVVLGLGMDLIAGGEIAPRALLILAHTIFTTSTVAWLVTPAWAAGDPRAEEDARLLGAGPLRAYFAGTGRHLPGAIRIAVALAFWYGFAAAGTVAILGGSDAATTESALAFGDPTTFTRPEVGGGFGAQQSAVALVQLLVGVVIIAFGGLRWPQPSVARPTAGRVVATLATLYLLVLAAALWVPLGAVVMEAAEDGALAEIADIEVGGRSALSLLAWTVVLAGISAFLATGLARLGAGAIASRGGDRRGALARWTLALPAALTGATVGWGGLLLADWLGVDLDRTYVLTVVAHALLGYPFALRILGTRRRMSRAQMEDALVLGATERSTLWRWSGRSTVMSLGSAFLVAVVLSAGEVAAASLLTPPDATPAALGLLRGWADGGGAGADGAGLYALATALAGVTVVAFVGAEWLRRAASRVEAG